MSILYIVTCSYAKYFLVCCQGNKEQPLCVIPVITSIKEEEQLIQTSAKVNANILSGIALNNFE